MDALFLSRLQFALTIAFHYIYPPINIGLSLILVITEGCYLRTKDPLYKEITKFWVNIFGLCFAIGAASGIVMEFQFGTNWAHYSRFVGDVFGTLLAAEGLLAFFLESTFLGVLLFGWNRVSKKMHFVSTVMVFVGAHLSAVWIVVANSWQQTPAGFHIVGDGALMRAEMTSFWDMVFNPSSLNRLSHVLFGAWLSGCWVVIAVGAYYILRKRFIKFAEQCLKIGLLIAAFSSIAQLFTGHLGALTVSKYQPAKLAAFEGHFTEYAPASLNLFGWVDEKNETVRFSIGIPGFLSFLAHGDFNAPVIGLKSFPKEDRPPVNIVFQTYHLMIAIGMGLIGLSFTGLFFWWKGILFETQWLLALLGVAVVGPQAANELGWFSAEIGRQPWVVYGILRTKDAVSTNITAHQVGMTTILFTVIYSLLFALFIILLARKIQEGPAEEIAGNS